MNVILEVQAIWGIPMSPGKARKGMLRDCLPTLGWMKAMRSPCRMGSVRKL